MIVFDRIQNYRNNLTLNGTV